MSWFDVLVLLLLIGLLVWETRQEAGRGLLDALALLVSLQIANGWSPSLTQALGWTPLPGTDVSPGAFALLFGAFWAGGMVGARYLHSRTRWSMDNLDPLFGLAFGLVVAIGAGHVITDVTTRMALLNHHGTLPAYLQNSAFASELRDFRTYHYVINTFHGYQYGQ